jgi:hypothetical protein
MSTVWEHFEGAVLALVSSGTIKDRLAKAYRDHLVEVSEDDLPREIREEFRVVARTLTRERPLLRGEDAVRATLRKMSPAEADALAVTVVRLFGAIPHVPVPARHNATVQVVPLYLAEGAR